MSEQPYRMCTRCVMDTSDPEITFDDLGVCNHCREFDEVTSKNWHPDAVGAALLEEKFAEIKKAGEGKSYDCLLGLSGGVDSSYLALKVKEYGLRPLVFHVDAGWNSELAVHNIERVVKYCGYELFTAVLDWEEVRDIQLAYLKAGVANQDVVQDHGFFATLYHFAVKEDVRYVINGGNIATESIFPNNWHHGAMDAINLKAIHKKFGTLKLRNYKTISFFEYYFYYPYIRRMNVVRPLNYMHYDKKMALDYLSTTVGYKDYGRKHGESVFTKFFQNYYLPKRFGYDKRRPHLSSRILSGEISRDDALASLSEPLYDNTELLQDKEYIARKLRISVEEFDAYVDAPLAHYSDFANWDNIYSRFKSVQNFLEKNLNRRLKRYS